MTRPNTRGPSSTPEPQALAVAGPVWQPARNEQGFVSVQALVEWLHGLAAAVDAGASASFPSHVRDAVRAYGKGWYKIIPRRGVFCSTPCPDSWQSLLPCDISSPECSGWRLCPVYLVRFWPTQPNLRPDGSFDSANSRLLHLILEEDREEALHDHPWNFQTKVLAGGYTEQLLEGSWETRPDWSVRLRLRNQYHAVRSVLPGTWTEVVTGSRVGNLQRSGEDWTFLVPSGPVPAREYLARAAPATIPKSEKAAIESAHVGNKVLGSGVCALLSRVFDEVDRARVKFPSNEHLTLAFAEEAGEVVKAMLDRKQGKATMQEVEKEIIQAMAMLVRLWGEGDSTLVPKGKQP